MPSDGMVITFPHKMGGVLEMDHATTFTLVFFQLCIQFILFKTSLSLKGNLRKIQSQKMHIG